MAEPLSGTQGWHKNHTILSLSSRRLNPKNLSQKTGETALRRTFLRTASKSRTRLPRFSQACTLALWKYHVILLPKFAASQMVTKLTRRFKSKAVRMVCHWSHFKSSATRLSFASWCKLVIRQHDYTSKTCNERGTIHDKFKVLQCFKSEHVADGDIHATRGILLRCPLRSWFINCLWVAR